MRIAESAMIVLVAAAIYYLPAMGVRTGDRKTAYVSAAVLFAAAALNVALLFRPTLPGPNDWILPLAKPIARGLGIG